MGAERDRVAGFGRLEDGLHQPGTDWYRWGPYVVLVNAWWEPLEFVLPATRGRASWRVDVDTRDPAAPGSSATAPRGAGDRVTVSPRSIVVLSDPRRD